MTVSKDKFLRDMDFYCVLYIDGTVKTSFEAWAAQVDNRLIVPASTRWATIRLLFQLFMITIQIKR